MIGDPARGGGARLGDLGGGGMLGIPNESTYDLRFRAFGFPVRVVPFFWLGALLIGPHDSMRDFLLFLPCVFASILIHELGHAFLARRYGQRAQIILTGFGGLMVPEGRPVSPLQKFLISGAGPLAQFVLLGIILVIARLGFGLWFISSWSFAQQTLGITPTVSASVDLNRRMAEVTAGPINFDLFWNLLFINFVWPVLNLLPLWPLDGGQMTQVVLVRVNPRHGTRWTHIVGLVVAGLIAAYSASRMSGREFGDGGFFTVMFFGLFALINFQMLQMHHHRYITSAPEEDEDWWRK